MVLILLFLTKLCQINNYTAVKPLLFVLIEKDRLHD